MNNIHKNSFDCLTLSSDNQYLVTAGDHMLKFWDENNFQVKLLFFIFKITKKIFFILI